MIRVRYARPARRDLNELREYLERRSRATARRQIERIRDAIRRLAAESTAGSADGMPAGLRYLQCDTYLIFFGRFDDRVEIVRILHGARDWQNIIQGN